MKFHCNLIIIENFRISRKRVGWEGPTLRSFTIREHLQYFMFSVRVKLYSNPIMIANVRLLCGWKGEGGGGSEGIFK